ncbi:universal stress protein [Cohnella xylanilytica]|uniref:Universal stress protein n=1 Tax=Cohnella xylanilytica TaxID=557555 RepID=A0A841U0P9_9BACL|nr:universal stress protein [Cohnella xylanilytica]MBB6692758.1 universal stress protein [Cohnella xylanilytica]
MTEFRRKTPEELLYSIRKARMGRLKIVIGSASGAGKTYHMLQEGHTLKAKGIDVVVCAASAALRPETDRQIGDLERMAGIPWTRDGVPQEDLDLEALVARDPEVALVDGLAHRNREGARFPARLDDIQYLLSRGISVITTINVYELDGVDDVAYKLTGIKVRDTAPSHTLELADEVRLIDVTPETILERLSGEPIERGKSRLLMRGNLAKLRELSLRLVASGVNDSLEKHREELGLQGPSGASERILVATQYHWNGSIYVRRGQQIAKRLGGDLRIVSFVRPKSPLTKEAAAFKRSILQLADKVEGTFEEVGVPSRRAIPRALANYAVEHKITRIVLGHSRESRWQELRKGSVAGGLVKRIRNTDLFFVADRARTEGERILPTRTRSGDRPEPYRRLSETELEAAIERIRRGKFKLYVGAAPGVGKTYAMLREGNELLKRGIDVMIGLLETHGRAETLAQAGELRTIPRLQTVYMGSKLEEMDTDAIIKRNPEVVLIDELAHANVPGSSRRKRYEDVLAILNAGISVISTLNVQHLESLNDSVEQITGIRVRETVPDSLIRLADEVQLIDVAPEALQQRMKEGKIYDRSKIDQALSRFFKLGNLIALRELALREIADDVDERLEAWDRSESLRGPWRREEVIFVAVTTSGNAERLIRRGFRIANRLKAAWRVSYVHAERSLPEALAGRLEKLKELTVRLGGAFEVECAGHRRQIAVRLIRQADEAKATQMIVGQSARGWLSTLWRGSVVGGILRHARHMDVLIVADFDSIVRQ